MKVASLQSANDFEVTPTDRAEIVDALYRFGAGQDLDDRSLFESAFATDATVDFMQPALRLGVTLEAFKGQRAIADAIYSAIGSLDTTHSVTNPRIIAYDDQFATLSALVEAQHLPTNDHSRHLLLKNIYTVKLSRQGRRWVIEDMKIENVWMDGDPTVLFPQLANAPDHKR
jgi:hypothetical protein